MATITLSTELMEQLKSAANRRSEQPADVLETAIRFYLRQMEQEKIQDEIDAYHKLHPQLLEKYRGDYVAIHEGRLIDHDADYHQLHTRIRQKFGNEAILIRQVTDESERVITFRSPILEKRSK